MVGIGGLNRGKIDRSHCKTCGKRFEENESKTMTLEQDGFICMECDGKKHGGNRFK